MTSEQHRRWLDFSCRMAVACYAANRRPSGLWILARVAGFIENLDDVAAIEDWDSSGRADIVGDLMSHEEDAHRPSWDFVARANFSAPGGYARLCYFEELAREQYAEQYWGPIRSCVRAGLDVVVSPSAGVLGFTLGDIRSMYPNGIPPWVADYWPGVTLGMYADATTVWL